MSEVLHITEQDALQGVLAEGKVVLTLTAPSWCVPCRALKPHLEKAAALSDATFVAVDIDNAPWSVAEFGVQGVPTVMLYEDGEFVKTLRERTVVKLLSEIS